jgi:phosphate transport system permease protein
MKLSKLSVLAESSFKALCLLAVVLPLVMLFALIADVFGDGMSRLNVDFLAGFPSRKADIAGIYPALVGSLLLISISSAIGLPVGIGAAIYLEEYSKNYRMAHFVEINVANLAGVPSVIYGLLGLEIFVRVMGFGHSVMAGACTMALLMLPIVITASREALRTVPLHYREACYALGATRWQTIRQVVLPMALPGILTGAILSISRALGEAAPLIVVGAATYMAYAPDGLDSEFTALPIQIFNWVSRPQSGFLIDAAAGIIVLLFTLLVLNGFAIFLRNRYQGQRVV